MGQEGRWQEGRWQEGRRLQEGRWQGQERYGTKRRVESRDEGLHRERALQKAYGMQKEAQGVGRQRRRQRQRRSRGGVCGGDEGLRGRQNMQHAARKAASGDEERRWLRRQGWRWQIRRQERRRLW